MKILYGISNRYGAAIQLKRFILNTNHDVRIAAFSKTSECLPTVDWTLDAIYTSQKKDIKAVEDVFGYGGLPLINLDTVNRFIEDIIDWEPDLVISDYEHITGHIAKLLHIHLIYSSSVHLMDGIIWHQGQTRFLRILDSHRKQLGKLPKGDVRLISSPFGVLTKQPGLKNRNYKWSLPYYMASGIPVQEDTVLVVILDKSRHEQIDKILRGMNVKYTFSDPFDDDYLDKLNSCNFCITSGESNIVSDAIFSDKKIILVPNRTDPEVVLNASLCELYGIGKNLGQVELAEKTAITIMENAFEWGFARDHLPLRSGRLLHERINEWLT